MKVFLRLLLLLLVLVVAGVGYLYWQATKGAAPEALEAAYMTSDDAFYEIDGARVRIRQEGDPAAQPILLIHGFTHSLETWNGWANDLRGDYRVIRYDLLGHGLTGPDPKERYAPEERARFIGAVMEALDIDRAVIAGNSLGGLAAWRFAASDPERVSALILISPGAYPLNGVTEEPAEIPAAMKAYLMTTPEAGVRASAELIYGDDSKITPARLKVMRDMMRRRGNGAAMIKSLEEFTLPDPTPALNSISVPTLILWGEEDQLIPVVQGRRVEQAIPNATLRTYPGVGHAAQEEAAAQSVRDVIDFLNALEAETPPAEGE